MQRLADALDQVNIWTGKTVRWFALLMVLLQFTVVLLRYVFGFSSIALNESVLYLHAALFMLGAGYTLLVDGHVRVDIFLCRSHRQDQGADRCVWLCGTGNPVDGSPAVLDLAVGGQFDRDDGRGHFGGWHSRRLAFEITDTGLLHSFDYSVCRLLAQTDHCLAQWR